MRKTHTRFAAAAAIASSVVLAVPAMAQAREADAPPVCVSHGSDLGCTNISGRTWVRDRECDGYAVYALINKAGVNFRVDNNNGCSGADAVFEGVDADWIKVCENVPNATDPCSAQKTTGW